MDYRNSSSRSTSRRQNVGVGGVKEAVPRYSRLFVVGGIGCSEDDFKAEFCRYGHVEYVKCVKDKNTGSTKGLTYIKFAKASAAATALESLEGKKMGSDSRPIKIVIASERTDGTKEETIVATRLFIKVPKTLDIPDIKEIFSEWGDVEHVSLMRDHATGKPRGMAYVNYHKFSEAATAVESCDSSYNAVFAEPKSSAPKNSMASASSGGGNSRQGSGGFDNSGGGGSGSVANAMMMGGGYGMNTSMMNNTPAAAAMMNNMASMMNMMQSFQATNSASCKLRVLFNPSVSKDMFWALFNIVPGLVSCDLVDMTNEGGISSVVYNNPQSAAYAMERINGFEYPTGSRLTIRIDDSNVNYTSGTSMGPSAAAMGSSAVVPSNGGSGGFGTNISVTPCVPDNVQTLIQTIQQATNALQTSGYGGMINNGSGGSMGMMGNLGGMGMSGNVGSMAMAGGGGGTDAQQVCSAILPARQPLMPANTRTEERLFFAFKDMIGLPDPAVISDAFCRFGNLIEATCIPRKRCGYARYASAASAQAAIKVLNDHDLQGARLRVQVADDDKERKRPRME